MLTPLDVYGDETHPSVYSRRLIKDILNRQTLNQFTSYAKQQYPDSVELQEHLVAQLQEQHFQQYMQQMMEHSQDAFQLNGDALNNGNNIGGDMSQASFDSTLSEAVSNQLSLNDSSLDNVDAGNGHKIEEEEVSDEEEEEDENGIKEIANASMWTRKDIVTFKESIMAEGKDGVLKVGHGEIATIRVPTHHEGNCIFWEFATDHYDIGFGLMFEWTSNPDNQVSIHISESDEDEEEEDFAGKMICSSSCCLLASFAKSLVHSSCKPFGCKRHREWPSEWLEDNEREGERVISQYYHPDL